MRASRSLTALVVLAFGIALGALTTEARGNPVPYPAPIPLPVDP